jgi:hypothetical protein
VGSTFRGPNHWGAHQTSVHLFCFQNKIRQLRHLEQENAKLKRVVADLTLDNVVLKDLLSKNW